MIPLIRFEGLHSIDISVIKDLFYMVVFVMNTYFCINICINTSNTIHGAAGQKVVYSNTIILQYCYLITIC